MRKLFFFTLFVLGCSALFAQKRTLLTDRAVINDSLKLGDRWIYLISDDSTFSAADHRSVATTKAIKDYISTLPSGIESVYVSSDTLFVQTADSTYRAVLPTIGGTGTVTSVGSGFGLTGGPVTSTGTILADSTKLATLYALQDSASAIRADFPANGNGIYGGSGTVADVNDFLAKTIPANTFAIGECTNCTGFEDIWSNYENDSRFAGYYNSPSFWGGMGLMIVKPDSFVMTENFLSESTAYLSTERGTGATFRSAYIRAQLNENGNRGSTGVFIGGNRLGGQYGYKMPDVSPSWVLGDTSLMAWVGTGGSAVPIFIKKENTETVRDTILRTDHTALKSQIALIDCSGASRTVNPPSSPSVGDWFAVSDATANSATNNITIDFDTANQKLYGVEQNYILNVSGAYVKFMYAGSVTGWIATKG